MESEFALLALLVAGYALIAARLERVSVGPALAFIVIGLLLSDEGFGWGGSPSSPRRSRSRCLPRPPSPCCCSPMPRRSTCTPCGKTRSRGGPPARRWVAADDRAGHAWRGVSCSPGVEGGRSTAHRCRAGPDRCGPGTAVVTNTGSARSRAPHPQCREWAERRHRHAFRRPGDRPGDSGRHRRGRAGSLMPRERWRPCWGSATGVVVGVSVVVCCCGHRRHTAAGGRHATSRQAVRVGTRGAPATWWPGKPRWQWLHRRVRRRAGRSVGAASNARASSVRVHRDAGFIARDRRRGRIRAHARR